jgi:hypothetical protein
VNEDVRDEAVCASLSAVWTGVSRQRAKYSSMTIAMRLRLAILWTNHEAIVEKRMVGDVRRRRKLKKSI